MDAPNRAGQPAPCPADCGRIIRPGLLVCPPCWRRVPRDLQAAVNSTWAAYRRNPTDARWAAYAEAREAALDHLNPRRVGP